MITISKKIYVFSLLTSLLPLIILSALFIPAIEKNFTPKMIYRFLCIVFSSLLSSILIARFLSFHITEPIQKLVEYVKKMESGDFEPVEIKTGDDLEILGRAFNRTGKEISRVIKELREIDEAKTQFLSVTSHELRTPLTPIKSQLQLLMKGYLGNLNEKQIKSLEMIERNTDRLNRLIQELLDISRIQSGRLKLLPSKQNIANVVRDVVEFMRPFVERKGLVLDVDLEDIEIEFDIDKITQVIQNLISNAIKFTETGKIVVGSKRYGNGLMVFVRDTGIGMSEERCRDIFKPFFQIDSWRSRKVGGVGLGLAISKGIVEAHGGRIWCKSRPNEGSIFYFVLPPKPGEKIVLSDEEKIRERMEEFFEEKT